MKIICAIGKYLLFGFAVLLLGQAIPVGRKPLAQFVHTEVIELLGKATGEVKSSGWYRSMRPLSNGPKTAQRKPSVPNVADEDISTAEQDSLRKLLE